MYKHEKLGIALMLASAAIWGIFPVLVNSAVKVIPPITFAALSTVVATVGGFFYLLAKGKVSELKRTEWYGTLAMIAILIIVIPFALFSLGNQYTSGTNATMLLLVEIIFTVIVTPYFGEKTTGLKVAGATAVFFGGAFILYNGSLSLNGGDLLIIASTITYPFGNFYNKRALNGLSPSTIVFARYLLASTLLVPLALVVEKGVDVSLIVGAHWKTILFMGLVIFGVSKILMYEGLKHMDISKFIMLVMSFPLFSLLVIVFYTKEPISAYQWIGSAIMLCGVFLAALRPSTSIGKTRYAPR